MSGIVNLPRRERVHARRTLDNTHRRRPTEMSAGVERARTGFTANKPLLSSFCPLTSSVSRYELLLLPGTLAGDIHHQAAPDRTVITSDKSPPLIRARATYARRKAETTTTTTVTTKGW